MLQSVCAKLINSVIKEKVEHSLEKENFFPQNQFGFIKNKCTTDAVMAIVQELIEQEKRGNRSILLSTDIKKAFDNVLPEIVIEKLHQTNTKKDYINWIRQAISKRKITYSNNKEEKTTKYTNLGLPQGCKFSPMLFNVYTAELHKISSDKVKIIQYADDVIIVISDDSVEELQKEVNKTVEKLKTCLDSINLEINTTKSNYMIYKKRKKDKLDIKIGDIEIKECNYLKILGIYIDGKLKFKKQVDEIKKECEKYTNILKIFGRKNGGAHPKTLYNVYKSLIQSRINYVGQFINPKDYKLLQKINNNAIRICFGFSKTTPIHVMLSEIGETSIAEKIEKVYGRYVIKQLAYDSNIGKKILGKQALEHQNNILERYNIISKTPKIPVIKKLPENLKINIRENLYKKNENNNQVHRNVINSKFKNALRLYTDASISNKGNIIAIYIENFKIGVGKKIEGNWSIYNLELLAIHEALQMITNEKNIVIFTDSKSGCEAIKNNTKKDLYVNKIKTLMYYKKHNNVTIEWVPAHCNIEGNEKADEITKNEEVRNLQQIRRDMAYTDIIHEVDNQAWHYWKEKYNNMINNSGYFYKNTFGNSPIKKPWFINMNLNIEQVKIINRVRSGHPYDKKFLNRMKLADNNKCEVCNETEDGEHII